MQNVSLLAGCDMRVSGFAQVKAQLWFGALPRRAKPGLSSEQTVTRMVLHHHARNCRRFLEL